jgi:hypothetical protein
MKNLLTAAAMAVLLLPCSVLAQSGADPWDKELRRFDAAYWQAFNDCDVPGLAQMNTEDLEFYHDVGGVTYGRAVFARNVSKNICSGNDGARVRREGVEGSVRYYPLRDGGKLYGAVVTGDHQFYRVPKDGPAVLVGQARFTHTALLRDGKWQVARVLSYDHGPAPK